MQASGAIGYTNNGTVVSPLNSLGKNRYYDKKVMQTLDIYMTITRLGHHQMINGDNENFLKIKSS